MTNNNDINQLSKSFVDSFNSISKNLYVRYDINMYLDFINEFVKYADNTRDIDLQNDIRSVIIDAKNQILNYISLYENRNKENND